MDVYQVSSPCVLLLASSRSEEVIIARGYLCCSQTCVVAFQILVTEYFMLLIFIYTALAIYELQ